MSNYTPGDYILYNDASYALIQGVNEDGTFDIRIGSNTITSVPNEKIEGIKLNPNLLSAAGFERKPDREEFWWFYNGNGVRLLPKVDDPSQYEVEIGFLQASGGTIYFLDYFHQLQELYKKSFNTDLFINFSYTK